MSYFPLKNTLSLDKWINNLNWKICWFLLFSYSIQHEHFFVLLRLQDFFLFGEYWIIVWLQLLGFNGCDCFFEVVFDFEQERIPRQMQTEQAHCFLEVWANKLKHPWRQAGVRKVKVTQLLVILEQCDNIFGRFKLAFNLFLFSIFCWLDFWWLWAIWYN